MVKSGTVPGEFDGLAAPARRALAGAGISSVAQLSRWNEADVAALHGMGPNALKLLKEKLAAKKLKFAGSR